MPTREELIRLSRMVRGERAARIRAMTRDEKFAELKAYYAAVAPHINLDIDQIKRDQWMLGLDDSKLDEALMICAALAGVTWQMLPMSAEELKTQMSTPDSDFARHLKEHFSKLAPPQGMRNTSGQGGEEPINIRKSRRSNLDRAVAREKLEREQND